ncbi:hypothetical protein [Paenibacillus sp.]|uniref:hypothetical protein n=1 Tax=Paenibacillus sp. TaxID=58172 RepID=UPI002D3BD3EA|nr:hypothetical protein [Paenibacillus sp.]HZG58402.1 hypothetical protein [Paenibacillus sp.]
MTFRNLFRKEFRSLFPLFAVFSAAVFLLHLVMLYKQNVMKDDDYVLVIGLVIPFVVVSVLSIGSGYYQLLGEWRTNTIYLLLSLPVRGWKIVVAKLAASLTLLFGALLWLGGSFAFLILRAKWPELMQSDELRQELPAAIQLFLYSAWIYALAAAFLLTVVQFAFLCGRLVARFQWVVELCAFLGTIWLTLRISPPLSGLLAWLPDLYIAAGGDESAYLHAGPFLVLLLLGAGFTWLNGTIFEKVVEV